MTAEWRPSAAAGLLSFGNFGSAEQQTAAVCAAEPVNEAESGCTLERELQQPQAPQFYHKCTKNSICSDSRMSLQMEKLEDIKYKACD